MVMKKPVQKTLIKPADIESLSFIASSPLTLPLYRISFNYISFGKQASGIMSLKSPTVFMTLNKEFRKLKTMWKRFKTS
jgi:hypothetical protein